MANVPSRVHEPVAGLWAGIDQIFFFLFEMLFLGMDRNAREKILLEKSENPEQVAKKQYSGVDLDSIPVSHMFPPGVIHEHSNP